MSSLNPPKSPVKVPFVCPACAGANRVHLITLSRAGGTDCSTCGKWLRSADVARAMHSPRAARTADSAPIRVHGGRSVTPVASGRDPTRAGGRALTPRHERIVWPPTAATRAAATRAAAVARARLTR